MALFNTPPATPSPTMPETADILAVARIAGDGHAIDPSPVSVDAVPKVGHHETELIFDGTNFVASWTQEPDSSTVQQHIARIAPDGTLIGGDPVTGASTIVNSGNNSRIGRFGSGTIAVWGHRLASDFFSEGFGIARFGADGSPLDPLGNDTALWMVADYGAGWYALPEIVWGNDRALLVWATQTSSNNVFDLGCAVAYPW
jgi:hypothetical protein